MYSKIGGQFSLNWRWQRPASRPAAGSPGSPPAVNVNNRFPGLGRISQDIRHSEHTPGYSSGPYTSCRFQQSRLDSSHGCSVNAATSSQLNDTRWQSHGVRLSQTCTASACVTRKGSNRDISGIANLAMLFAREKGHRLHRCDTFQPAFHNSATQRWMVNKKEHMSSEGCLELPSSEAWV